MAALRPQSLKQYLQNIFFSSLTSSKEEKEKEKRKDKVPGHVPAVDQGGELGRGRELLCRSQVGWALVFILSINKSKLKHKNRHRSGYCQHSSKSCFPPFSVKMKNRFYGL